MPMKILTFLLSFLLAASPADILQQAGDLFDGDRYQEALSVLNDNLDEIRKSEDQELLSEALSLLSSTYFRLGNFDAALRIQEECYDVDLALGDPKNISSSLNNLAAINLATGDYSSAEKMILEAIRYEEQVPGTPSLATRYGMASDVLLKQHRPEEAVIYAEKAYDLEKAAGRTYQTGIRASQRAEAYIQLNRLGEAWSCLSEASEIFLRGNNLHSLSICRRQQGSVAELRKNLKMAANYYRDALRLTRETGNLFQQKMVCDELATVLTPDDPAAACGFLKESLRLADTLYRQETARMTAAFNARYDLAGKEHEIALQQQELKSRRVRIVLLSAIVALLCLVVLILIRLSTVRGKNNRILRKASDLKDRLLALGTPETTDDERAEEVSAIVDELSTIGETPDTALTAREQEIANLACEGLLSKEIAARLNISQRTVESHKNNIFRKLGINTTVELVRLMSQRQHQQENAKNK